jgi:hypothetical protein
MNKIENIGYRGRRNTTGNFTLLCQPEGFKRFRIQTIPFHQYIQNDLGIDYVGIDSACGDFRGNLNYP